jgi:hypothetical protein
MARMAENVDPNPKEAVRRMHTVVGTEYYLAPEIR